MFTFKYQDNQVDITITTSEILAPDIVETFRSFLLAVGFHPETVKSEVPRND
jgi:hypothetical protein